ncbi:MAG: nucleoside hydrolase [Dehalococcoidia bacterium]|nr:nucleoside hydrolase [Dehalococcoidia bacterium]
MNLSLALDVDPGLDDALAIMLALRSPGVRVDLVTTVAGNGPIDMTTRNALRLLRHLGASDVPVARGAAAPLRRPLHDALRYHGPDALGGVALPEASFPAAALPAHRALFEFAAAAPGERSLVATGPLTNVALALREHPEMAGMLREVVVMGGAFSLTRYGHGNETPFAEFNVWQDPEAAAIVFASGVRLSIVGLDVTNDPSGSLDASDLERLRTGASPYARLAADLVAFAFRRQPLFAMHDPLALAALLDRSLFTFATGEASVDSRDNEQRGRTTLHRGTAGSSVAIAVDGRRFRQLFLSRMLEE